MKKWQQKEKSDAKQFKARRTPRSGGLWFAKGDSKSDTMLIENKTTDNNSFSITKNIWEKIEREAIIEGRIPIVSVEFGKEKKHEIIILSKDDFSALLGIEKDTL